MKPPSKDPQNPQIAHVADYNPQIDLHRAEENAQAGLERCTQKIPRRYQNATVTHPEVIAWVRELVAAAAVDPIIPKVTFGRSLLITGMVGIGKTHETYGALRALAASGASVPWRYAVAADLFGRLRDFDRGNTEAALEDYATAGLLVIDDLGVESQSDAKIEATYRLVNHRYEAMLPTVVTTNLPLAAEDGSNEETLPSRLGRRVVSRLVDMLEQHDPIVMSGPDRRMQSYAARGPREVQA